MHNSIQVQLLRSHNPHRYGSLDYRRFNLIQSGMTVGEFIAAHNVFGPLTEGGLGERWHAVRYLKYMLDRGFLQLPGAVFATRGPRLPRLAATTALSSDLDSLTFGVELECYLAAGHNHSTGAQLVSDAGVECRAERYGHTTYSYWKVVPDGSLGGRNSAEFVSPILQGDAGLQQVVKVCNTLQTARTRVSRRCGLHVHVGVRNQPPEFFANLLKLYVRNVALIDQLVPPSRRGNANTYCQNNTISRLRDDMSLNEILRMNGRFCKLNYEAYGRHGTVEFRHAAGTVEADKTTYWVKFCLRLCLAAKAGINQAFGSLAELLVAIGANDDERTWLLARAERLSGDRQQQAA
jgi:hypothetical protein